MSEHQTFKVELAPILSLIPLIHIVASAFYLSAFTVGFGGGLSGFMVLSDLVHTSLADLPPLYLVGAVLVVPTAIRRAFKEKEEEEEKKRSKLVTLAKGAALLLASVAYLALVYVLTGLAVGAGLIIFAIIGVIYRHIADRLGLSKQLKIVVVELVGLVLIAGAAGLWMGLSEGDAVYGEAALAHPKCGRLVVLRQFGGLYIAVQPNNEKVLMKDDCTVKITLPQTGRSQAFSLAVTPVNKLKL